MKINLKEVSGISVDSRAIEPGYIFVAIKGNMQNGHDYISAAIANGAKVIVHQDDIEKVEGVEYFKVLDARSALSELSQLLYPKQSKYIMGVTGTNGKTSIVHFVREILLELNKKIVSIGTMGVLGLLETIVTNINTLPAEKLHPLLQKIAENNIDYVAMECSSHGIDQHRIDQVKFSACGFSNLSQDHLDYHENMENYLQAKEKLFSLMKEGYAVLNTDIPEFERLANYCKKKNHKIIGYGKNRLKESANNVIINSIEHEGISQKVTWEINKVFYQTKLNLVGEFQVYNLACAIGLLMACEVNLDEIMQVLPSLKAVTGRMELVSTDRESNIFIDYAHTPDALVHALKTLKPVTKNRLIVVFGCGGNRDKEKRPLMGKIADEFADLVIITDDNPRNENPNIIRQEIIKGCKNYKEIPGREEAIEFAIKNLQVGDNLLIAGKGHENYQIIGDKTYEFSDISKVREIVNNL